MNNYLKIENPGVCPPEGFTLLGASNSRGSNDFIGKFGSGNKHGINVCIRNNLNPIIYSSNLKLEFFSKKEKFQSKFINRLFVKLSGKDESGKTINRTDDLNRAVEFGEEDWTNVQLGLREFVSNALDGSLYHAMTMENIKWCNDNHIPNDIRQNLPQNTYDALVNHLNIFIKSTKYWESVNIEIVPENKVRAKSNTTRIFIPLNDDVFNFFNYIDNWFLHFGNPHLLQKQLLPKRDPKSNAKIYRKGVFVREWNANDVPSLFDYNIDALKVDECRTANDWESRYYCAQALGNTDQPNIDKFVQSLSYNQNFWEHDFDSYALTKNIKPQQLKMWNNAFLAATNNKGVITKGEHHNAIQNKGYIPIKLKEGVYELLQNAGAKITSQILSNDELLNRTIEPPQQTIVDSFNKVWNKLIDLKLVDKDPPQLFQFTSHMDAGATTFGFQRDNGVYINSTIAGNSTQLNKVMLEEIAHYLTNALDETRDLQDWAFLVAAKLL